MLTGNIYRFAGETPCEWRFAGGPISHSHAYLVSRYHYSGPNDIEMYSGPLGAPLPALPPPPYESGSRKGEEERTRYEKRSRQHYRARDDDPRDREVHRYRDRDPYERKIRSREFLSEVGRRRYISHHLEKLKQVVQCL